MLRLNTQLLVYIVVSFDVLFIILTVNKIQNDFPNKDGIQLTTPDLLELDTILENTRSNIKRDLSTYNFTYSGVYKLEDLLIEFNGKPIRNVILSTWRSGSTFLSDLINTMPGGFVHFEPLMMYQNTRRRSLLRAKDRPKVNKATKMIKQLFKCFYSGEQKYQNCALGDMLHVFKSNKRLWEICKDNEKVCRDTQMLSQICRLFPFQSMILVRYRLRLVKDLLDDKQLNVKVVFLVRDPRGVMHSRSQVSYCTKPDCYDPKSLCNDMQSDYLAALPLLREYSDRFMILRYEDLVLNLKTTTETLLKFLRLGPIELFDDFKNYHTTHKVDSNNSTFKESDDAHQPFKWKNVLGFKYVQKIQEACFEAMELWGYKLARNSSHMTSIHFDPLGE